MAKTSLFVAKLQSDYPTVRFEPATDFSWSPDKKTIYYSACQTNVDQLTLLHEVAHAALGHHQFRQDIDLLKLERQAWEYVRTTLAPQYNLVTDTEQIEDMMDTYRDWLHARSKCPHCAMTGIQSDASEYHCLGCARDWRVNEARRCELRRYTISAS